MVVLNLTEKQRIYVSVFFILIGIVLIGIFAYLYGWWTGYKHGVSVNPELLARELEILGIGIIR